MIGLTLTHADAFAAFQPRDIVYHDDVGDYATNEPTMDGTADAITLLAHFGAVDLTAPVLKNRNAARHSEGAAQ